VIKSSATTKILSYGNFTQPNIEVEDSLGEKKRRYLFCQSSSLRSSGSLRFPEKPRLGADTYARVGGSNLMSSLAQSATELTGQDRDVIQSATYTRRSYALFKLGENWCDEG